MHAYASAAGCTLRGHVVIVFGFKSRSKEVEAASFMDRIEAYYARGTGWVAATPVENAPAEQSDVHDVALSLGGLIEQGAG